MNNIIELKNVYKHYITNKKNTILKKINYKFKKGLIYSLVGPSGSGKSTLLNLLSLIDKPSSGEILINDSIIKFSDISANDIIRADKIGIIYQQNNLLPDFTALENVYLARLTVEKNSDKAFIDAKKIIKSFGLSHRHNHFPSELSGGERQRIALLRSIINKPSIVFADEPTGNLDDKNVHIMIELITELRINYKTSFVIATHDERLCDIANKIFDIKNCNLSLNR